MSDNDIRDVASRAELTHSELHHLFGELGISHADIENQERIADTKDYYIQADRVLQYWRQKNGKDATRQKVLDSLQECKYNRAKEILIERWKLTV